jgi:CTP:molybdopterin cytidylyltransferase MocA
VTSARPQSPALVILAAGASERLGECKALVAIGATTPLSSLLDAGAVFDARDGLDVAPPLVIAGAHFDAIRAAAPKSCEVVFNPDWELGRTSGVALASRLRPDRDLCLAPVDVPLVPRRVFEHLARAWDGALTPAEGWLAPRFRDRFGHPIVAGRGLLRRLSELPAGAPLRSLRALARPMLSIAVDCERVLDDLDTPSDLARLRNLFP